MRRALVIPVLLALAQSAAGQDQRVQFNRDIRPILSDKCFFCHGPDEETREAGLRLDTRDGALADLGGYAAIVPGQPDESELLARVAHSDPGEIMPPPKSKKPALTDDQLALLRRWIDQGAEYQGHWAFEPLAEAAPPDSWTGNPIDYFIESRLTESGIEPSPPAEPAVLLRRLHLDLTGLLPNPAEQSAIRNPKSEITPAVDRLLASPHYGERWGRHWLDQARYADSHGYSIDGERQMWPFRDWVIKAFNDDLPFDRFTVEQLAGDLLVPSDVEGLPEPSKSQLIATAFHRNTLINQEGGSDPEQFRVESVMDRVSTTGAVWLGLTLSCAQCHTHKFDPITHREYYQLFAFFNDSEDVNGAGPTIEVREHEVLGDAPAPPEAEPQAAAPAEWHPVRYQSHRTTSGAPLRILDDRSLLVDRSAAPNDAYDLAAETYLDEVSALRLRVLTDPSLPQNGPGTAPNGNFVLTAFRITHGDNPVAIKHVTADHEQPGYPVAATLDDDQSTGWAINVGNGSNAVMNAPHEAVFVFEQPLAPGGKPLEIRLEHDRNRDYLVGRFALELSSAVPPLPGEASPATPEPRTAKLMVMRDRQKPRDTFLLTRGDFTRPDKMAGPLTPGVLSHVPPALPATGRRPNRLDLARWLVDPANPLTPRVTVNRVWMRYFGRGLVETEEDFGTQGSPPTHPELLDYLARRFIEDGWSMKMLHRLIVTSKTYQRSSNARPDLAETDPRNLLLARQNRVRLDAEIIRDAALSSSGLLTPTIGGPSVYPPQPDGIYSFTQNKKNWRTSTGPDRFRRAMYTFFYRSAPYPLFSTFDAPDFQTTCTRRSRSNTPLQALTIANDPAFLEIAQGLAARVLREAPAQLEARIAHAVRLCLNRQPSAEELRVLKEYATSEAASFANEPETARALLNDELRATAESPEQLAALVGVARAILNTDNFITRE